jgi:Tol biopolymer transport system component
MPPRRILRRPLRWLIAAGLCAWSLAAVTGATSAPRSLPDVQPYWSWDARLVAFDRNRNGRTEVWLVPAGHGAPRRLGVGLLRGMRPAGTEALVEVAGSSVVMDEHGKRLGEVLGTGASWSPDGGKIAFVDRDGVLAVADATGANPRSLDLPVTLPSDDVEGPVWSPDGSRIAVSTIDGTGASIHVVDVETGHDQVVTADGGEDLTPTWSWDSLVLAYATNAHGRWQVWTVHPDGLDDQPLEAKAGADFRYPQWSPFGHRLSFLATTAKGSSVSVLDLDAHGRTETVGPDAVLGPARWSPTALQVAYAATSRCGRIGIVVANVESLRRHRATNGCPGGS